MARPFPEVQPESKMAGEKFYYPEHKRLMLV